MLLNKEGKTTLTTEILMIKGIIDFGAWVAPKTKDLLQAALQEKNNDDSTIEDTQWQRFMSELSPLDNKYLKSRFGPPNRDDYYIDLLFYHLRLRCFVVVELLCAVPHNRSYVA